MTGGDARVPGQVAGDDEDRPPPQFADSARWRYAAVRGGRQKGALPIVFELPSDASQRYIFHRPLASRAVGRIELDCRPMGSSRSARGVLLVGAIALIALIAVEVRGRLKGKN